MSHGITATEAPPGTKYCPRCDTRKPLDEFPLSKGGTFGRYGWCRDCKAENARIARQERNADGRAFEENLLRALRSHGVDLQWYTETLTAQMGVCAICFGPHDTGLGRFNIDHDHTTGKARGLLCQRCNMGLGALGDDPEILRAAAAYLDTHHANRSN